MSIEKAPQFLEHYKLHDKPEAAKAAKKQERITGETGIFTDRSKRTQAYLDRLERIFLNPDKRVKERNLALLKPLIYQNTLIQRKDFPESYFKFQKRQAFERGMGEISFTDQQKEDEINSVIENQKLSLDAWLEYLTSNDCQYPTDVKFFAMQGVLQLGSFNAEEYSFAKRYKTTTASFAEIDHEALSVVLGALEARYHNKDTSNYSQELLNLIDKKKSFGDIYAETMHELDKKIDKESLLPITDGEWKTFKKGSNPQALVDALVGKRSNLCIADIGSATRYLEHGSMEIYFSNNRAKQPAIPRIALAISKELGVYEIRGTYNKNEDIDPFISDTDILSKKLKELPNGEAFAKKENDMKTLTTIYNQCFQIDKKTKEKTYLNPQLSRQELQFLYQINSPIEGFGYQRDPRIKEIQDQRNPEEDMLVIFECTKEQIAKNPQEINSQTKAYLGQLEPEIFDLIQQYNIEHIYTSFPEGKIRRWPLMIGGRSPVVLEKDLRLVIGDNISDYVQDMIHSPDFTTLPNPEQINLVRLKVRDLFGDEKNHTTTEIIGIVDDKDENGNPAPFTKGIMTKLGLELCPPEVGPYQRLADLDQPVDEWYRIAMKPIAGRYGFPSIFSLEHNEDGLWLDDNWMLPAYKWIPNYEFVFRLRKVSRES